MQTPFWPKSAPQLNKLCGIRTKRQKIRRHSEGVKIASHTEELVASDFDKIHNIHVKPTLS